ncbi:membrane protein insertion efficiency factor YidD [Bacteroidales bacterium]|nr:membrane protein insertion efficiency factor YidD [Bacteroidales bacterium]
MSKLITYFKIVFTRILIVPIKIYQWIISPILPMNCRHYPSCSNYTIQALHKHGVILGLYLGIHRILRCHPWGTHGVDEVPEHANIKIFNKTIISD